jgi:hypothetical protein
MDIEAGLTTSASMDAVLKYVDDLAAYPQWMSLVHSATRVADAEEPTWDVELRASVGPFARSKRLRLVRTVHERGRIVFERRETDGRTHAMWRLTVTVAGVPNTATSRSDSGAGALRSERGAAATNLTMQLHYNGRFFVGVVESILQQHIDAGRKRLSELLSANA